MSNAALAADALPRCLLCALNERAAEAQRSTPAVAEASMQKHLSILALFVMMVSLVELVFAHALFSWSPIATGLQICAASLMLWARLTFGMRSFHGAATPTEGGLVTTGPYHYIHNPISIRRSCCSYGLALWQIGRWAW
jgi:protein-S-isoprenylcysteine O-methyltransferase Ste14